MGPPPGDMGPGVIWDQDQMGPPPEGDMGPPPGEGRARRTCRIYGWKPEDQWLQPPEGDMGRPWT